MRESRWSQAVTLVVTLFFGCAPHPPAQGGNLVVNGSFEIRQTGELNNYIDTLTPDREDLVGWRVTGRSVDWIGPTRWKASHGEHCLDVDAPGGIQQTLHTTPGRDYQLRFDLAGNVETEPLQKVLRVSINGDHRDFSFDAAAHTCENLGWVRKELVFTAQDHKTTLSFSNASQQPTASGVALDNVILAEMKPGRYTVRTTDNGTILVDSDSGQTWMLRPYQDKTAWLPVESVDPVERLRQLGAKVSVKDAIVRAVDLTDSTITDTDMEIFSSLGSLEHLILNGCRRLTDAGLVHLRGLTGLKGLGLERTRVTDAGLANLSGLIELDYLSLNWTQVGDAGLKHLCGLTNLGVLYLCETNTADAGLISLKNMSKLQWLDLRGTQVTDAGLAHLSRLSQLRLLSLHGIRMTDAGVPPLTELLNLEVLTLSQTRVTDAGLLPLTKLPKLNDLDLQGTSVTPTGVDALKRALPNCRVRFQVAPPQCQSPSLNDNLTRCEVIGLEPGREERVSRLADVKEPICQTLLPRADEIGAPGPLNYRSQAKPSPLSSRRLLRHAPRKRVAGHANRLASSEVSREQHQPEPGRMPRRPDVKNGWLRERVPRCSPPPAF